MAYGFHSEGVEEHADAALAELRSSLDPLKKQHKAEWRG